MNVLEEIVQPTGHENIGAGIVVLLVFCTITPCTIVCHLVCLCCAWCAAPRERELVSDKKIHNGRVWCLAGGAPRPHGVQPNREVNFAGASSKFQAKRSMYPQCDSTH
ncbi:hypothetical protein Y032_0027g1530 [Ancylostoma ceylanicum]|uniref:Uncharacterized protein n=1 Tax=Ancylostoma ceylanicum TaxID=53326 RepID=A0A016USR1_9BILA|nr:hypothetical protein Y032_0027g1530 [Ancylostoma ceylanicum]